MRGTKRKWIPIAVMLAAALIVYLVINFINRSSPVSVSSVDRIDTVVIDAGHGGIDGGATGIGGVVEKSINLQIALKLKNVLQANGYRVVMIREADTSIHSSGKSIAQQKKSDMNNRLKIINETPNSLTVSIHQNHFEQHHKGSPARLPHNTKQLRRVGFGGLPQILSRPDVLRLQYG